MAKADHQLTDDLIKSGVRDSVVLQQRNPTAINDGVDPRKAFQTDSPVLDLSRTNSEAMKKLTESTAELDISTDGDAQPSTHESPQEDPDAAHDPSGPPSHPNLEILSPDGELLEDGGDDGQEGDDEAGPDQGAGIKKKKKKKPKSKRAQVSARFQNLSKPLITEL